MGKSKARRVVIDTNIASSASTTEKPDSTTARNVLTAVRDGEHLLVLSPTQKAEWLRHMSGYTGTWLTEMLSRKQFLVLRTEPDTGLRDDIFALECGAAQRREMLKDVHLVEAALATDRIVISAEENVLALFNRFIAGLRLSHAVAWVNPAPDGVACAAWLQQGAPLAQSRLLEPKPAGA